MGNLLALANGTELVGDYKIRRVLGAGGFGITYLADEVSLSRLVTIKEYFPSDFAARKGDREAAPRSQDCSGDYKWGLDRFIEEAQTLARFEHPNIVRVFRYFRANNTGYMVLQWEEGKSLKNWLRELGRAPRQAELDQIVAPLLDALELIHKRDFLHRDIAPDNIIIRTDRSPVLIDFGSARGEIASHSRTVSALVKPGYSPYEQYATTTSQQGPWTDIYALGATLYQAVTGKRPPDAPSRVVQDEYVPARDAAVGSFRPGFLAAIDKALAIEPGQRPQSVMEWRGPLLAPPEKPAKPRVGLNLGLKKAKEPVEPPPTSVQPTAVMPPPPDAPQAKGQFVDFVEGLKAEAPKKAEPKGKAKAEPVAAGASAAAEKLGTRLEKVAAVAEPAGQSVRYGLGYGPPPGTAKAPTPASPSAPKAAPVAPASPAPARKAEAATVAAPQTMTPQAPVARPIRKSRAPIWRQVFFFLRPPWRGLLFKLGVGAGVASLAVAYQNHQLPSTPPLQTSAKTASSGIVIKPASVVTGSTIATSEVLPTQPVMQLVKQKAAVAALAVIGSQRRIATLAADGTVALSDVDNGSLARSYTLTSSAPSLATPAVPASGSGGAIVSAAMAGPALAVATSDGAVALWDTARGERVAGAKRIEGDAKAVALIGEGERVLAGGGDGHVTMLARDGLAQLQRSNESHNEPVTSVVSVPGRSIVASSSADKTVKAWNSETLALVRTYRGHNGPVGALDAAQDGKTIASGAEDGQVRLWSTASSRLIRTLRGHSSRVTAIAFAPNGEMLASAAKDGSVRLWDVKRGHTVHSLSPASGAVVGLAFLADGKRLATAGEDGSVKIWDVSAVRIAHD